MAYIRDYTVTEVTTPTANPQSQVEFPSHKTNDYILLMLAQDNFTVPSLPSGYTAIQDQAGTSQAYRLCYKKVTGADNSETCPTLSGSSDEWHIGVFAIAGAPGTNPISTSAERTATDNVSPFTWTAGASTGSDTNCLIMQFINSDSGLALTCSTMGYTNLVNGDAGTNGFGCAYTFQPSAGAIIDATWKGRANDDTTACLVAWKDDGNGTRPSYADPLTSGEFVRPLGSATESDTYPVSLTYGAIGMKDFTQFWEYDGTSTYTDDTTDINDVGTSDVTITNAVGAIWYFGYDYLFSNMVLQVATAQVAGTIVWEYYNGSTWATLTVSGVLTATGWVRLTWTPASDWVSTSVNSVSKYYVRMRISATFTTAPILSRGHVGGWLTAYDTPVAASDSGLNPYMDATSMTPAASSNFGGCELQFGSALDLDTGILLLHHTGSVPRDYAVDPGKVDNSFPITNVGAVNKSGSISNYGGFIIVLADADSEYEAYSIHSKGALSADVAGWNVAAIGLNDGAMPYGQIGTLNKSAVTRMLMLPQGAFGAYSAYVSSMVLVSKIVFAGGDSTNPMNIEDVRRVANNAIGTTLAFLGTGDFNRVYAPIQFGGGHPIKTYVDGAIFQFPTKYDGKKYLDWNASDNVAGVMFYGTGSSDELKFPNSVWKGSQPFRWEFHSSHSASAVLDFSGNTVQGATVTLRSTVTLDRVKFSSCPAFTLNGANLTNCSFTNTKVDAASPGDADDISDSSFTKTTGTQHGMEISGTAADMTLDGVTFTGYASSNGSTGNEAIYVNIASGTMTINITGGGSTPSIRTAGATVTVQNAVTVKVTVKDVNTGAAIENARVLVEKVSDGTDILTGLTNSSGIVQTSWAYPGDTAVTGKARRASAGYGTLYKSSPISGTVTSTGLDITVLLIPDE
jgi:hypothetical protein